MAMHPGTGKDESSDRLNAAGPDREITKPDTNALAKAAFEKVAQCASAELEVSLEDYALLEKMNRITSAKYAGMKETAGNMSHVMQQLQLKYDGLAPYLRLIDDIDQSVTQLEEAAYKLDAYAKRLEAKFKQLEKR